MFRKWMFIENYYFWQKKYWLDKIIIHSSTNLIDQMYNNWIYINKFFFDELFIHFAVDLSQKSDLAKQWSQFFLSAKYLLRLTRPRQKINHVYFFFFLDSFYDYLTIVVEPDYFNWTNWEINKKKKEKRSLKCAKITILSGDMECETKVTKKIKTFWTGKWRWIQE